MTVFKDQKKRRGKFIKRAAIVIALAAGALFFSHRHERKEEAETIAGRPKVEQPERKEKRRYFRSLARRYSARTELQDIIDKARRMSDDIKYGSFDCPLVLKQPTPKEARTEFLIRNTTFMQDSNVSTPDISSMMEFLLLHSHMNLQSTMGDLKLNRLKDEIKRLKKDNDVEGMIRLLDNFDKLNLVWDGEHNLESLSGVYLNMYMDAKEGGLAPDIQCLMKNLRASAIFDEAVSALEDMICRNPGLYQSSFVNLPDSLRHHVSFRCFLALKMDALQGEIQKMLEEYGNPGHVDINRFFKTGSEFFLLARQEVELSVKGYRDPVFKKFYTGKKMDSDSILGEREDPQAYEVLIQSVMGPFKYGVVGLVYDPK